MNNKKNIAYNNSIRLILVEIRVIYDILKMLYIIRAKMYIGVMILYLCMSAMRVYNL